MIMLSDTRKATLRWVFVGATGIRAGWSAAIFTAILAVPTTIAQIIAIHLHITPGKELLPWRLLGAEAFSFALIMAATWVMGRIERRSVWAYGLAIDRPWRHFSWGWVGGFLCLSALVGLLTAGGYLIVGGLALHGAGIVLFGALWLAAFTLVGFSEETLFRGYLQATLARGMGFWPAALVMSLLFGIAHISNGGESVLGITEVVVAGMVFCLLLRVSGSLWMGIGFHGAWDWAQSYFYGTPDSGFLARHHLLLSHAAGNTQLSGGTAGPEGSVLAPPIMCLGLLVLVWICRRARVFHQSLEGQSLSPQTPLL